MSGRGYHPVGLRQVGHGIPTLLSAAFVTGCMEVDRALTNCEVAADTFWWSLNISHTLTRVVKEAPTIVMKTIDTNSNKIVRSAVGCTTRGNQGGR